MEEEKKEFEKETQPKATFDDLLKDPDYQAEFDKKVAKAIAKSIEREKADWQKAEEKKRSEAEELARMTEEEKHKHELSKANEEKEKAIKELNAYKLKEEATKIATEKGMDITLLGIIDYTKETAESVKAKLEEIDSSIKKAVEKEVNEKLKQPSPKGVASNPVSSEKAYLDEKYKNNRFYKN